MNIYRYRRTSSSKDDFIAANSLEELIEWFKTTPEYTTSGLRIQSASVEIENVAFCDPALTEAARVKPKTEAPTV